MRNEPQEARAVVHGPCSAGQRRIVNDVGCAGLRPSAFVFARQLYLIHTRGIHYRKTALVCLAVWAVGANFKGDFGSRQVLLASSWGAARGVGLSSGARALHNCARARRPTSVSTWLTPRVMIGLRRQFRPPRCVFVSVCWGRVAKFRPTHTSL